MKIDYDEFERVYNKFFDNVYRYVFLIVKKQDDSLDVVQDVFMKVFMTKTDFNDDEHLKAWILHCAYNCSMDYFRSKYRKVVSIDSVKTMNLPFEIDETIEEVLKLPEKYRTVIYMYYYEEYSTEEIAKIIKKPHATVRTQLKRGRELLKMNIAE